MHHKLEPIRLRNGETVEAAIIHAPDEAWAERVEAMLQHKGDPWNWQNSELLRRSTGVETRFYLLHRNGAPFANIMLVEIAGVALLGHVWTEPADRGSGASSVVMQALLDDFHQRRGRAIFLGTGFDSAPWHYYRRRGFEPIEPGSGYMELYVEPKEKFERSWFGANDALVEPLDWPHWPTSIPLFLGHFEGVVRLAAVQIFGRVSSEGPLLPLIREERRRQQAGEPGCARVLRDKAGAAVLGFASRWPHPLWPDATILDVYCHPGWWHRAADLLADLSTEKGTRTLAYADVTHKAKRAILENAGFSIVSTLPQWVRNSLPDSDRIDVVVYAKT